MNNAAIGGGDIALLAGLDRARACLKRSAPSKGPELPSWFSAKSNSRNGDVYSAKKELILAAQDLAERRDSFDSLWKLAEGDDAFWSQRQALIEGRAPNGSLTSYQSKLKSAEDLFLKAEGRYKAARERVTSLTRELTNKLQSQPR
jgi:hypothetical protein